MSVSYTVQVILKQPEHSSKNPKYVSGDIVGIHPLISDLPAKNRRLAFVHVHNAPIDVNFGALLSECVRVEVDEDEHLISKSAWSVDISNYTNINTDFTCDMDWLDAKDLFTRKADGLTVGEYYELGR